MIRRAAAEVVVRPDLVMGRLAIDLKVVGVNFDD
jgi:hypothetical protein